MPNKNDYITQMSKLNGNSGSGTDFFWKELTPSQWSGPRASLIEYADNMGAFSWHQNRVDARPIVRDSNPFDTGYMFACSIFDLWFYEDNGTYKLKLRNYQGQENGININSQTGQMYRVYATQTQMVAPTMSIINVSSFFTDDTDLTQGSLSDCFDYAIYYFRNVNIYVDGE